MTTGGISESEFAELTKRHGLDGAVYQLQLQQDAEREALLKRLDAAERIQ